MDKSDTGAGKELPTNSVGASAGAERATPYAYYALFLLGLANFFNYIDRTIVAVVGQRLKVDLNLTDAQTGFLLGTAFAVFYGVMGLGMGRLADALPRTRIMALGLTIWSGMTSLAAFTGSFVGLAATRIGVGIGEASANPCSHSLLSDYFPARNRSTVLATYLLGTHLGGAASLLGGGLLLQHWSTLCLSLPDGACRIADWRAAFLMMGIPGLVLAVLVVMLREPARQGKPGSTSALQLTITEFSSSVPPLTLFRLYHIGGFGPLARNLLFGLLLALGAAGVTALVGDWPQWAAVGLGIYSVTTWGKILRERDLPLYKLTFGCPTFVLVAAGTALTTCVLGAAQAWSAPYAMRVIGASPGQVGIYLGLASAMSAGLGVVVGGAVADQWKRRDPRAPVWITLIGLIGSVPAFLMMLQSRSLDRFVMAYAAFMFLGMLWAGPIAALIQDLVLQRMRGTAAGTLSLILILVGAGIGPYWAGKISTFTGSLATGLYSVLAIVPLAAVLLFAAARRLTGESGMRRRTIAREAGEAI